MSKEELEEAKVNEKSKLEQQLQKILEKMDGQKEEYLKEKKSYDSQKQELEDDHEKKYKEALKIDEKAVKPKLNLPKVPNKIVQFEALEKRMLNLKKDIDEGNIKVKSTRTEIVNKIEKEPIMLCVGPSTAEKVD